MSDCLFCKMATGEISPEILYEDAELLAFRDINPHAPSHFLVIPKRHIATINDLQAGDAELVGKLYLAAARVAADLGVAEAGYRTVMNCNADAGQTVFHIHLHVLAGRHLAWPPG
ncbi:histidine triad nucleotide-binding protein [Sulfuriflexus mobilis]|uniref:histidine triad nucleotide-binding protein n=1 Tax=Sulfuriflexus mobilis TaxID=1811807 RepID=UPI000F82042E|nr:histidine triad nucleotide-binding protein [Sulfuriflexus mobilis]